MSTENLEIEIDNELSGEDLEALIAVDEAEREDEGYIFIRLA